MDRSSPTALGRGVRDADAGHAITEDIIWDASPDAAAGDIAESATADYPLEAVRLLPPIPRPGAIWCAGMNTHSHFREVGEIMGHDKLPKYPIMFLRNANTVVGSGEPMEKPDLYRYLDFRACGLCVAHRCSASRPST